MEPKFKFKVYRAEEGGYWATCTDLPGCFTQGETMAEVKRNAREAIVLYLEALAKTTSDLRAPPQRGRPVSELSFALAHA